MVELNKNWPKKITVDKRIVKILSESTYENFPNALREIIINSYDADSSKVDVSINLKKEVIEIEDNGWGMDENDFTHYLRIAGVKKESHNKTASGRFIVGQFGIGFLSLFPFFKNCTIISKKSGSSEILFAEIPCYKYFSS